MAISQVNSRTVNDCEPAQCPGRHLEHIKGVISAAGSANLTTAAQVGMAMAIGMGMGTGTAVRGTG